MQPLELPPQHRHSSLRQQIHRQCAIQALANDQTDRKQPYNAIGTFKELAGFGGAFSAAFRLTEFNNVFLNNWLHQ
jgi:hypothetical protein